MPFLQVTNVVKKYPSQDHNAVDEVSVSMYKGEVLAVVGENGSGKTTLLKLIAGLEDVDDGEVLFNNKKIAGPSQNLVPGHKGIKMLAQDLKLMPKHTILENIEYDLRRYVQKYQEERMTELISLFRLEGLEEKKPHQLSGGQQQRVALAKALAEEAPLLLLDEPFSSMDIMLKDEVRNNIIRKAKQQGTSVIFITHDIKEALSLADKIVVMKDGKIVQIDEPKRIYEQPKDEYVAYLFGNVNVLSVAKLLEIFPILKPKKTFFKITNERKVSFRPEHIIICRNENKMTKGKVKASAYMGDSWQNEVEVRGVLLKVKSIKEHISGEEIFLKIQRTKIHLLIP